MTQTATVTVNSSSISTITETACDSYIAPDNAVYTSSGVKTAVIQNVEGCDSTITINLTITNSSSSSITVVECDSYTAPDNVVYTTTGTKTAVIPNLEGCDSTITINLTINKADVSLSQNGNVLTANASGAVYKWLDCNTNTPIFGESSQAYTAAANGSYALIVTQNTCTDTSTCVPLVGTGIASNSTPGSQIAVYPNPNNGAFVIEANAEGTYTIVNNLGQVIQTVILNSADDFSVEIKNLDNGIYFIVGLKDNQTTRQKIVVLK
jgi:hypothetical protein